jgi:hypothetical protein
MKRTWSATISPVLDAYRIDWQILQEPGPTLVDEGSTQYTYLDEALESLIAMDVREREKARRSEEPK